MTNISKKKNFSSICDPKKLVLKVIVERGRKNATNFSIFFKKKKKKRVNYLAFPAGGIKTIPQGHATIDSCKISQ